MNNICGLKTMEFHVREMSIGSGAQGTLETLRVMAALAREAIQYYDFCLFLQTVFSPKGLRTSEDVDRTLRPLYKYQNEDVETLYAPPFNVMQFMQSGKLTGDCDDIAMLYAAIFYAVGWPSRLVAMRTKPNDPEFLHVVVEVNDNNRQWKRYDATVPVGTIHRDYGQMVIYV